MPMNVPQTAEQMGAVPQAQAQGQQGQKMTPQDMDFFRNGDPEIKQALELFVGHPMTPEMMKNIPDQMLVQIAGMVHKLGVQGAVAMAEKTIPPQVKAQLKAI